VLDNITAGFVEAIWGDTVPPQFDSLLLSGKW
jgi:hypothetical protein